MKRLLLTLAFVCFVMPVLLSADTPEPPPAPPVPVNIAAIKARRAQIAELLKQDAADIAELQKQLKELGLSAELAPLGLGKQGPRGYSAYEVAKQNGFKGTQAEWLASLKGERGPQGPPGPPGPGPGPVPPPVVDSFTKAVQDAWADPGTNKTYLESLISVWKTLGEYAGTDATTGALYARYDAGFKAAELGGKMPAVMDIINKPLLDLMGGTSKPFTDDLRGKVKTQISKTLDVLGTLKR